MSATTDNTQLNTASTSGGDIISTEVLPSGAKIERVKIVNGEAGVDGGNVTSDNRFPVSAWPPEMMVNYLNILEGNTANYYSIMGSRSLGWNTNTTFQDCCEYLDNTQDLLNTPTAGQTLYLVSTSVNDVAAGTGARTVRIVYLDAEGAQQVRTDTLNGTTTVSIGTGYTNIQWMEVASVGSLTTAAGNVTVSSTNGAAIVATTFSFIKAAGNRSLGGQYIVPAAHTAYVLGFSGASDGPAIMDVRLRANVFADDRTLSSVFHFQSRVFLKASGDNQERHLNYMKFPALCVIKVSCLPSASGAGNKLDAGFKLFVVAD